MFNSFKPPLFSSIKLAEGELQQNQQANKEFQSEKQSQEQLIDKYSIQKINEGQKQQHSLNSLVYEDVQNMLKEQIKKIKCHSFNNCFFICSNKKCLSSSIICAVDQCQCQKPHQFCYQYFRPNNIIETVQRKIKKQANLMKQCEQYFDKLIDQISILKEKTINSLKFKLFQHHQLQIINHIRSNQFNKLNRTLLFKYFDDLKSKEQYKNQTTAQQNFISLFKQKINLSSLRILDHFQKIDEMINNTFLLSKPFKCNQECSFFYNNRWDSKILKYRLQLQVLKQFIPKKKIEKFKLLYRASEESFSINKFFAKCLNMANTYLIIQTEYGKIIGGYNPNKWMKQRQDNLYQGGGLFGNNIVQFEDPSLQTFIFSLTNRDKFILTNKQYSTFYTDQRWGPCFGKSSNADLKICQNANEQDNSIAFSQMVFKNVKYDKNVKSYQKFTGSSKSNFKIKEWQVFQLIFQ